MVSIPLGFECGVEMNLLAGHRLRLDDPRCSAALQDLQNRAARFIAIRREIDRSATTLDTVRERRQMHIQFRQGGILDLAGLLADEIGMGQLGPSFAILLAECVGQLAEYMLQRRVFDRGVGGLKKLVMCFADVVGRHAAHSSPPMGWMQGETSNLPHGLPRTGGIPARLGVTQIAGEV